MNNRKIFYQAVIPSMLAFALSGIYSVADGFFVGNSLGDNALAAINIAYPLTAFIQAVGTGIGMGGAVQFAIHNGSGDYGRSRQFFGISLLLLTLSGLLFTAFFLVSGGPILRAFGARGVIFELGEEYFRYIAYGTLFQILATGIVPFIRNMGSSVTAMLAMIGGFVTNILLDYLFVWVLPYGMAGAAAATVIGQAVTLAVCVIFLLRKRERPSLSFHKESLLMAGKVLFVAISPFGLTFSPNITLILINKSAVFYGGDMAVACYASISYISSVVFLLLQGVSDGSQPLISLCYGKKEGTQAVSYRNMAYRFALGVSVICMLVIFFSRGNAAALFGASREVTENVGRIFPVFIAGYLFVGFSRITTSYFYATEKNRLAYILIYGEPLCLLLFLTVFPRLWGIEGTWVTIPLSQLCMMLLSLLFIRKQGRQSREKAKQAGEGSYAGIS
nr:MATE family efflux transporter [uncultured Eisenbergiella sp.]